MASNSLSLCLTSSVLRLQAWATTPNFLNCPAVFHVQFQSVLHTAVTNDLATPLALKLLKICL
ncbi:hypothetical protein I79_012201 [Cricetulus griseus]|uniref:Uncharacterized protein n=1 Tax=Cricetulus griseus TaxID=10029 RepID=G3HN68_CRIGR|nr:hypothetical protein I79_012201 [Cricetulus griseus]